MTVRACVECGTTDGVNRVGCALCGRCAEARRDRRRRAEHLTHGRSRRRAVIFDGLAAACWCDTSIVEVTRAEVLACTTRSCGAPGCAPPVAA